MRTDKKLWRNRKAKKELARRLQSENPGLEVAHPHAAGVDVGNSDHYVAGFAPSIDTVIVTTAGLYNNRTQRRADEVLDAAVDVLNHP